MQKLLFIFIILSCLSTIGQQQKTYQLNTKKSIINWKGSYTFQISEHTGTVNFINGELITNNGKITGGNFTIDMTSINNEENRLHGVGPVQHLKDTDFFDVTKHPTATLRITKVIYFPEENRHQMFGDLTIKGISKSIEFWSVANGETQRLQTKFRIDRTRWGITHNNKLKNHAISHAIEFDVNLQFQDQ